MDRIFKDLSVDKIKLIYEFDKSSPLFCRVANFEVSRGNFLYAVEVLENGLKIHKDYPSAYIILALALAYSGDEHRAKEALEQCSNYFSEPGTIKFYNLQIDKIIAERNSLPETKRTTFVDENKSDIEENKFFNIDDRLDILAEELSKAKIKVAMKDDVLNEEVPSEYGGKKITSETLAKIYVSQKNYNEAISVYNELIKEHPEKEDYYVQQIVEIETMM